MFNQNSCAQSMRAETLTQGSVAELTEFVGSYIRILFPTAGIEYWSDLAQVGGYNATPVQRLIDKVPATYEIAAYAHEGHSEGIIIRVSLVHGETAVPICMAKAFTSRSQAWAVACAAAQMLKQVFKLGRQPSIVDLAKSIPGLEAFSGTWYRALALHQPVEVRAVADSSEDHRQAVRIVARDALGRELLQRTIGNEAGQAAQQARALCADLQCVFKAVEIECRVVDELAADPPTSVASGQTPEPLAA